MCVNEIQGADRYYQYHERCIWCDMVQQELEQRAARGEPDRRTFVMIEPFASKYPFETWLLPKHHQSNFAAMTRERVVEFAGLMQDALRRISTLPERTAL